MLELLTQRRLGGAAKRRPETLDLIDVARLEGALVAADQIDDPVLRGGRLRRVIRRRSGLTIAGGGTGGVAAGGGAPAAGDSRAEWMESAAVARLPEPRLRATRPEVLRSARAVRVRGAAATSGGDAAVLACGCGGRGGLIQPARLVVAGGGSGEVLALYKRSPSRCARTARLSADAARVAAPVASAAKRSSAMRARAVSAALTAAALLPLSIAACAAGG